MPTYNNAQEISPERPTIEQIAKAIQEYHMSPDYPKRILNEYENLCLTASGKKGLSAYEVAEIICRDKPELLQEKELVEILKAWNTDRKDLKEYRRRERMQKKDHSKT